MDKNLWGGLVEILGDQLEHHFLSFKLNFNYN